MLIGFDLAQGSRQSTIKPLSMLIKKFRYYKETKINIYIDRIYFT